MHGEIEPWQGLVVNEVNRIAIALDFKNDEKIIAYALQQGQQAATYVLMHVVESVSARYAGDASDDYETEKDKQRLEHYAEQLKEKGFNVIVKVGYRNRVSEIVRIVKDNNADMLVMGAHRHRGFFDFSIWANSK
jgi:manganese transport protein